MIRQASTTDVKAVKKLRKTVKPRKWGYGYVLKVSLLLTGTSLILNVFLLARKGQQPVEANFAFRETLRATRRAKTLATYARARGPMLNAIVEGYSGLSGRGVTHLEDAIGGFISGPNGFWKNEQIYAYQYQEGPDVALTLKNFKESKKHWTNGNPDPCVDRTLYIGSEKMPNVTTKNEFVELVIGFVNIDCSASTQFGYVSIFKSRTHGGPLIGRVYRASTVCNFDHFVDEQKNAFCSP